MQLCTTPESWIYLLRKSLQVKCTCIFHISNLTRVLRGLELPLTFCWAFITNDKVTAHRSGRKPQSSFRVIKQMPTRKHWMPELAWCIFALHLQTLNCQSDQKMFAVFPDVLTFTSFFPKSPPGFMVARIRNFFPATNSSTSFSSSSWPPFSASTNVFSASRTLERRFKNIAYFKINIFVPHFKRSLKNENHINWPG